MNSKLAIIIPYFKIDFFEETLQSLEAQTCQDFVVYIGNDASPNDPKTLIENTLKNTKFHYKKFDHNLGKNNLCAHWNRTLNMSSNENWFMILGDDDVLENNFVDTFYKSLTDIKNKNASVVKFSQYLIDENNNTISEKTDLPATLSAKENLNNKLIKNQRASLSEHIFNKSAFPKHQFVDIPLAWGADHIAVLETAKDHAIYCIKDATVAVRMSQKNISGQDSNAKEKKHAKILFQKYLLKNHYKLIDKKLMRNWLQYHLQYEKEDNIAMDFDIISRFWYLKQYKKAVVQFLGRKILGKL